MRIGAVLLVSAALLAGCNNGPDSAYPDEALEACADMSVSEWSEPGHTPVDCDDVRIEQGWEGGA